MKLISLLLRFLNVIYYIITFPFVAPLFIYKQIKIYRWRKNPQIGDKVYFINILNTKSIRTIKALNDDKTMAGIESSNSYQWMAIRDLKPL